jgi:undecaprenyl-diphosphatase
MFNMSKKNFSQNQLSFATLLIIVTVSLGFVVRDSTPIQIERTMMEWLRDSGDISKLAGPAWLASLWITISFLGDTLVRIFFAICVVAFLWAKRRRSQAIIFAGYLLVGIAFSSALKYWIDRPRPQWVPHLDLVTNQSFPSGHALNSTLFYMGLACLFMSYLPNRLSRVGFFCLMLMLTIATGISRVALGVHYPTDVLAGWLLGTAVLILWLQVEKRYVDERVV